MPLTKVQGGSIESPVDLASVNLTGVSTAASFNVTGVVTTNNLRISGLTTVAPVGAGSSGIVIGMTTNTYAQSIFAIGIGTNTFDGLGLNPLFGEQRNHHLYINRGPDVQGAGGILLESGIASSDSDGSDGAIRIRSYNSASNSLLILQAQVGTASTTSLELYAGRSTNDNARVANSSGIIVGRNHNFYVSAGGTTVVSLTSSGNIGLSSVNPSGKLDVAVTSTGKSNIVFTNSGESPILSFKSNGVQDCGKIVISESLGGGYLSINTKTESGVDTPRLNINTTGNVGIATDNIRHRLQVWLAHTRLVGIGYSTNTAGNNINTIKSHNEGNNPEALQLVADTFTINTGTTVNGTERLRISGTNGNIGIGSTGDNTPTSKLTLYNADNTGMRFYRSQGDRFGEILYDTGSYFAIRQPVNDPFEIHQNTGNAIFRVDSSGNVGINTRTTRGKLFISVSRADINTSSDAAGAINIKQNSVGLYEGIYIERSGERKGCWMSISDSGTANDGLFFTHNLDGVTATSLCLSRSAVAFFPGTTTTASAANAFLDSGTTPANRLYRSTSSLRYKKDIENVWEDRGEIIFDLRPVWYRSKCENDRQEWSWYGFIAEEVAEVDPRLVHWTYLEDAYEEVVKETQSVIKTRPVLDTDGNPVLNGNGEEVLEEYTELVDRKDKVLKVDAQMVPDGVQYDRLTVLLTKSMQQMKNKYDQEIATLKAEIETLKNIINN